MAARILTLAALGLFGVVSAAPIQLRQTTCYAGVYMIVARGSNEAPGLGKVAQVVNLVNGMVPNSGSIAVDYPAAIISDDSEYPESVSEGITNAKQELSNYVSACPGHRVALLGYSQGGNVMTDLLAGGVDKPAPISPSLASSIIAVTVFGDPSFTVGQSFDRGTATKSGIFARSTDGASLALLNTYASILQSYCNLHDTFCARGDSLNVHYQEVPTFAQDAANFIAAKAGS